MEIPIRKKPKAVAKELTDEERKNAMDLIARELFPQWFQYQELISRFDEHNASANAPQQLAVTTDQTRARAKSLKDMFRMISSLEEEQDDRVTEITHELRTAKKFMKYVVRDYPSLEEIQEIPATHELIATLRSKLKLEAALSGSLVKRLKAFVAMNPEDENAVDWAQTHNNQYLEEKRPDLEANMREAKEFMCEATLKALKERDEKSGRVGGEE